MEEVCSVHSNRAAEMSYRRGAFSPENSDRSFNNDRGQFVSHVDLVPKDGRYAVSGPHNTRLQAYTEIK
jgi:hypothetical protein